MFVWNHKGINKLLRKRISKNYYDDFKSELIMILYNMPDEKLLKAYKEEYLDRLTYSIIYKQWNSSNSTFYRKFRNNIASPTSNITSDESFKYDETYELDLQEFNNQYKEYFYSKVDKVKELLNHIDPLDKFIFELYFFEDMTYMDIVNKTEVNYSTIRSMVVRTLEKIKKEI